MCEPISIGTGLALAAGATAAGTALSVYQGEKQQSQAKKAAKATEQNAAQTAMQAEQAQNKANARAPDTAGLAAANALTASGGQGSTLLTGPSGIDPTALTLGKTTLLGA